MGRKLGSIRTDIGTRTSRIDMTDQQFGEWTARYRDPKNTRQWWCECSCGKARFVEGTHLRNGKSSSCGHKARDNQRANLDAIRSQFVGERFGLLTVTETFQNKGEEGKAHCRCACGTMTTKRIKVLERGEALSCGCLNRQASRERAIIRNAAGRGFTPGRKVPKLATC